MKPVEEIARDLEIAINAAYRRAEAAESALATARNRALEEAAAKATAFLVGDPANGIPLRNPMAHEIADAILALRTKEPGHE